MLCGIKNCKNWKRAFSKSTPVYPRLLWTKALPISKKISNLCEKNDIINASNIIHVFLLCTYFENEIWRCGFLYYSVILKKTSSVCIHQIYFYLTPSLFCLYLNLEHKSTFVNIQEKKRLKN